MSQERWDVVLRFLDGPLSMSGDIVAQGPVVRIGADPGPDGLRLDGYRGVDVRQATITTYGGQPQIGPVGQAQVRVAPHEHVDWGTVQPIRAPVHLSTGSAFHLGPPGRGATAVLVECRRLGVWEQRAILSDASQVDPGALPTEVREVDARSRFPWWLIPGFFAVLMTFVGGVGLLVFLYLQTAVDQLGPVDEGLEDYGCRGAAGCDTILAEKVNEQLYEGVEGAFYDFLMKANVEAAQWPELEKSEKWDKGLMQWVVRAEALHGRGWAFWRQLDDARSSYATVVGELRRAGLPDVLAAVPFQESRYKGNAFDTMLCANGWWQFQPEVAKRVGMTVRDCKFKDNGVLWSPVKDAPPINVLKNAEYVLNGKCRISSCAVDERTDLRASTRGAIQMFKEAYDDPELRYSGSLVQMVIASHNAGFDNSRYQDGRVNKYNIRHAYREYVAAAKVERAPDFVGRNITCTQPGQAKDHLDRCGGVLGNVTQKYVPYIVAQHLLAVCYYGTNYADDEAFAPYRAYVRGNGYCKDIKVPSREDIAKHSGKAK
jgi:hypothetical protein